MQSELPRSARAVIVGGGIAGCSLAYHLAQLGWEDVVVLEQGELGGGTTWHAAGLVGRLRSSNALTRINQYSADLYARLEAETGHPTGWNQVGSVIVAQCEERMIQLRRTAAMAGVFGVEAHMIDPAEIERLWPLMRTDDLLGGVWLPHDGKVVPVQTASALAAGAQARGVRFVEHVEVESVLCKDGRACGVRTAQGEIEAEVVALCGGMWTRAMGAKIGAHLPLYPVEHHYVVSEPIEGVHDDLPVARDPDATIYWRSDDDQILLGAFQARTKTWDVERIPSRFSFELLEPDWERFEEPLRAADKRIPSLVHAELPRFVNGPESFTPDNQFLLGETPGLRGLFVAAGFNSAGIACAGGAGRALAEWIEAGSAQDDLWSVDVRRFAPFHDTRGFLRERVAEVLGLHYQLAWPNREFETGRDLRRTPLHGELAAAGAVFGSKFGWERPNWFARAGEEPLTRYSFGRQNWHAAVGEEMRACREGVAIFEQSSFGKLDIEGDDVCALLQSLCTADVDVEPGGLVYTGLLNERGTYESDLVAYRYAADGYRLITSSSQPIRDADWIWRNMGPGKSGSISDRSASWGVLGVMGPSSRELLARLTDADLSLEAFPYSTARELELGPVRVHALRMSYVGELGWELQVALEQMPALHRALWEAGQDLGVANAGHYAIDALRLEKAHRAWGHELSPSETPLEAGLGFTIAWDKPDGFLGRDALLATRERPQTKRLVQLVLEDPEPMLWGGEPIQRDGELVGYTTSGAYGHTLGAAVALGWANREAGVDKDWLEAGRWSILLGGVEQPARMHLRAAWDPGRQRVLR